jgi:serine/threonine-protein kinase
VEEPSRARTLDGSDVPVAAPEADELVGRVVDGRYRVVARRGEGGMGLVYEAVHEVLGTRVALKILRRAVAADEEVLARFEREARSASAVGNEHIVDVRDFGRLADGSRFVVMELIEGVDLLSELAAGPLPWARACAIGRQICEALGAAHARGIVHRDLKAENVLLTTRRGERDFVKVVDFGIAKVTHEAKQLTRAGRILGTPEYMAPEQCAGREVDGRTDVYALGVLLYEMTTGRLPFEDADLATLVRRQMHEPPAPPSTVHPEAGLPPALESLILRCLAKDPDARFARMADVAEALERVLRGSGDVERPRDPGPVAGGDAARASADPLALAAAHRARGAGATTPVLQRAGARAGGDRSSRGPARRAWIAAAALLTAALVAGAWWLAPSGSPGAVGRHAAAAPDERRRAASEAGASAEPPSGDARRRAASEAGASAEPPSGDARRRAASEAGASAEPPSGDARRRAAAPTGSSTDGVEPSAGPAPGAPRHAAGTDDPRLASAEAEQTGVAAAPSALLETDPPGAEVHHEGVVLGVTPMRVDRPSEGERVRLELRRPGYRDHEVTLGHRSADRLRIALERTPPRARRVAPRRSPVEEPAPPEPPSSAIAASGSEPAAAPAPAPPPEGHRPEFMDPWAR